MEERIDDARSRQDEVDTNEQVFRELQRRAGKGRAQSLGAAWLDGVSVSQGHLVVLSTADIDFDDFWLFISDPHRTARLLLLPWLFPHSSCPTRFDQGPSPAITSTLRMVRSLSVDYGSTQTLAATRFGNGSLAVRSRSGDGFKTEPQQIEVNRSTCLHVLRRDTKVANDRTIPAGKADGSGGGVTR